MAETSYPAADGTGVTDAAYEQLLGPITGAGRYGFLPSPSAINTPVIFADNTGRQVKAYANQAAMIRGYRWESGGTPPVVALDANVSGNPRLDLIVLRLDRATYQVRLAKINGTPAATPAAPSPIQDSGTTGVWDLPLAKVRVTSSGTSGQPFIQASDVTAVDYWLTEPAITAIGGRSPSMSAGQEMYQPDTGRLYFSNGTAPVLMGERGAMTKITASAGWTNDNIYCRRVNGMVYFQANLVLSAATKAAGTDITVCGLPTTFRPDNHDVAMVGWMSPSQVCRVYLTGSTGVVTVYEYPSSFPNGGTLTIQPTVWPAIN